MSRIAAAFQKAKPVIPFVTAGHPTLTSTVPLLLALEQGGAGVIELGVPFSDPIADGPVIQASSQRALDNGATFPYALNCVRDARETGLSAPVVLMGYYNTFLNGGLAVNAKAAKDSGVDGFIISDLPPEEAVAWQDAARAVALDTIFLLAPTSTEDRVKLVGKSSTGFIYCVSRLGVTGAQSEVSDEMAALVSRIKQHTETPVAVGFGISSREQVQAVFNAGADGAVVGSALVRQLGACATPEDAARAARDFMSSLVNGTA